MLKALLTASFLFLSFNAFRDGPITLPQGRLLARGMPLPGRPGAPGRSRNPPPSPYVGVSYQLDNPPYSPTILIPTMEPESRQPPRMRNVANQVVVRGRARPGIPGRGRKRRLAREWVARFGGTLGPK